MLGVRGKRQEAEMERPAGPSGRAPTGHVMTWAPSPRGRGATDPSGGLRRLDLRSPWCDFRVWEAMKRDCCEFRGQSEHGAGHTGSGRWLAFVKHVPGKLFTSSRIQLTGKAPHQNITDKRNG